MNKYNYMYNFICVFFYTSYVIKKYADNNKENL
jgi:hypothetical protein